MIEPRSFPQSGSTSHADPYGAGARPNGDYGGDLHVRVLTAVVQFRCFGAVSDLRADEPDGSGLGLGK